MRFVAIGPDSEKINSMAEIVIQQGIRKVKNLANENMVNLKSTSLGLSGEVEQKVICPTHGEYIQKSHEVLEGRVFKTNCPSCSKEKKEAKDKVEQLEQQRKKSEKIKRLIGDAGIPKRFLGRSFDNYRAETNDQQKALKVANYFAANFDQFLSTGASLIFCGKPGTGKTHLASAIANSVCEQGRSALFLSVLKATRLVKESWRKDADARENDVYKTLISPDLLVLDEVGVQFGSEAEKLIIFEILNGRYEEMRPCILISNLLPSELSIFLGERVIDRMKEGGGSLITFAWGSYRPNVISDKALPCAEVAPVVW
ncbi:ATP-binding protein [Methylomonas koyamae]|uniref:ATP-binding protein n=1 Tax=Methylomonas koyamae TaxID=702114 RepID=UPI002872D5B1|nr:ATP-binding protein [Methylomonas koyamae]WNB74558.1 ATP-binding protein [Methylomonas koyamae]